MADTDNTAADTPNDTATSTTETTSHKGDVDNKTDDDTKAQDILTALGLNTIYVYISSVSLDTEVGNTQTDTHAHIGYRTYS